MPMGDDDDDDDNDDDDDDDQKDHSTTTTRRVSSSFGKVSRRKPSYSAAMPVLPFPFPFHRVCLPLLYMAAMWSCGKSWNTQTQLTLVAEQLRAEWDFYQGRYWETEQLLQEVTNKQSEVQAQFTKLKSTGDVLNHEMRMKEEMMERVEMSEENRILLMELLKNRQMQTAMAWIQQRQTAVYGKLRQLEDYAKEQSRQQVLQKYGPGPHRVEFQVQPLEKNQKQKKKRIIISTFMVELAPVDAMPHAVEFFLDMVSSKVWDNTVFYHHPIFQKHVVAAAPVHYGSFDTKSHHLQALGFADGLSFPEYSGDTFHHEEYTLGFSTRGPSFYINAMDNTHHHGPGGQDRHDLVQDADPCFGKLVWGKQVVQDMMKVSSSKAADASATAASPEPTTVSASEPVVWEDYDVTRIVQIRLVQA